MLGLAVAAPFALAALTVPAIRRFGRSAAYANAAVLAALAVLVARETPAVLAGEVRTASWTWIAAPRVDVALRMDALGLTFALIVLVVGAAVMAYAARYFAPGDPKAARTVALLTVFAGAMLGLVLADDVVLLFVLWEVTSVTSFFLIAGDGKGAKPAVRAFLVTAIGGLALLAAVLLLVVVTGVGTGAGSLSGAIARADLLPASPLAPAIVLLVVLAAATKSAQLPFHFWLPGAMVAPTPVSTYLHAATMVKAGIYLVLRLAPAFDGIALWGTTLVVVGGATALYGAFVAITRDDLKALLAYSTVSQLGLIVTLVGIGTPRALAAAGLHTVAHAAFKAALFMTAGVVDHETGTRSLARLGGLARALPMTAAAATFAALSMAGLPPLLGFVTKEEALYALVKAEGPLAVVGLVLVVAAAVGTVAYSVRLVRGVFLGPVRTPAHHAPAGFELPALVLAAAGLAAGMLVPRLSPLGSALATQLSGVPTEVELALWHGLSTPLVLTILIVLAGSLLAARPALLERRAGRLTAGADRFDAAYAATVRTAGRVARSARSLAPAVYVLPVVAAMLAVGVLAVATVPVVGSVARGDALEWTLIGLLAVALGGVVQARSRVAAVGTLGLTGFLVATWFVLHGAPDLALTQLLVETLTVALVAVVFRRLPVAFDRAGRRRRVGAAAVATLVGSATFAVAWLLTGRRPRHEVGDRFLAEADRLTGGSNVVNTILVDFRALDTLGEITVIAVAALGIFALVRLAAESPLDAPAPDGPRTLGWLGTGVIDSIVLRVATSALAPLMLVASVWLLWRGHDRVGGGFIGGLTAGAAVVLLYLSRGHPGLWQHRLLRTVQLVGIGLAVAVGSGLIGLALDGSFLAGGKWTVGGTTVARSLVFDVGVYVVVVALVVAILRHLGQGLRELRPAAERGGPVEVPR